MNRIKNSSLEELLELSNQEILDTQVWFAIVVWKYEIGTWNEAQRLASQLVKSNTAHEYLEDMRRHVGVFPKEINAQSVAPPKPSKIAKRESTNTYSNPIEEFDPDQLFNENYELLNMLVPDLETEIETFQPGHHLEGKSAQSIYGFVTLNCNEKDKRGYYLSLGINESSKSSITMLLFYDTQNQDLLTLYYEDSNGKFEVYDDIHSRKMTDLSQEETLNLFLNNKLKKLIGYRLLISNLDWIANKPLEEKTEIKEENKLLEDRFSSAMERFISRPINTTDYSEMVPTESYTDDDDEFSDPDEDELLEQIELQNEEIRELREENKRIKNTAVKAMFSNNMKLLRVLVPNLMKSIELTSFTVVFKSNDEFPIFKLYFQSAGGEFMCDLFELSPRSNVEQGLATFTVDEGEEMAFVDNQREFFGLKERIIADVYDEYSPLTVQGNNATFNWLIVLLLNNYKSSIIDPVYRAEVVENQLPETTNKPNDSDGANETRTLLTILGALGLTILGIKAFNK